MSEPRKNHLAIDGAQQTEEEHADSYRPISESDQEFRTSKSNLGKSKEKVSADPAEEKLLKKEDEVKITPMSTEAKYDHRNGDTKIELDAAKKQFTGLTKEELLKYADDPFWVRLRWFMFLLFWALWLCMLAGAVAIIVRAPKCAKPTPKTWYEEGPLIDYSESSPVDYEALEKEIPLFSADKIQGVFINPCENTYEVLQNESCITKFKAFLTKVQEKGIKFIVDLTANHLPTTHEWFQKSESNESEYRDYFTWAVGKDYNDTIPKEPNNWMTTLGEQRAWTWSAKRKAYYLHQYEADQADLNFHNERVVKLFDDVLRKWVDAGAAGVRLLHARQLIVSKNLTSDPPTTTPTDAAVNSYEYYVHKFTSDQPELHELFQNWSQIVREKQGDNVFTIYEGADQGGIEPEWFKYRNASMLHPPAAAPLRAPSDAAALATALNATTNWTALQITSEDPETKRALAAVSILLPTAPVLTADQLPALVEGVEESETFAHLAKLRKEQSVHFGEEYIKTVRDSNSTVQLLAVARWKEGQPGYVVVFNPEENEARADLTDLHKHFPSQLTVHHITPEVRNATGYISNGVIDANNVIVPAKSSIVLSYVVDKNN